MEQLSSIKNKIKRKVNEFTSKIIENLKECFETAPQERKLKHELILRTIYILVYGCLVNYKLFGIFGYAISPLTIPAYGIAFYLLKEEFPEFVKDCKR